MARWVRIICSLLFCCCYFGCIQDDTLVRVKPDGSGVIEETVLFSNVLFSSLETVSKGLAENQEDAKKGEETKKDALQQMMEDAKTRAAQYGPTAKFVSVAPAKVAGLTGYKAVYSFKDINTLQVNQNPGEKTGKPQDNGEKSEKSKEPISFNLKKGPVSTLTITMPKNKKENSAVKDEGKTDKGKDDPQQAEIAKTFFKDMRVRIAVQIEGAIETTNATYRDGSKITLVDLDFNKILEKPAVFEKVSGAQPQTIEEVKALVQGIEGLKMELNDPVVVKFR
ncbi:MAG: hypothetical protein A4E62_01584 [Syntrophorhabdus sp. PtaU1.Bin002]|nr:MAG: hypothetical protein A4E62_01584 [Syntrophorhabdus sp. PtaU1.Bin002]